MRRLTRDRTAEPVARETKISGANGDREKMLFFSDSAGHEQDWQPYPFDPYSATRDGHIYIYIHTANVVILPVVVPNGLSVSPRLSPTTFLSRRKRSALR